MKHYFLPENGNFYKANLHCHSNYSDGKLSPEELKKLYKENGYSVLAITDHEAIFDHGYLDDEDFLTIPGYEKENNGASPFEGDWNMVKTCHLCFYPKDRNNINCICFDPDFVHPKFKWMHDPELKSKVSYLGEPWKCFDYSVEGVNHIISEANKYGFLVTLNHLEWSYEDYEQFIRYEGMFATEIYNNASFEYNDRCYDMLLRRGKRIYCVAADDNHNGSPQDSVYSDSCGGYVMIKADALKHESIISALEKGNFYSSTGPQIKSLYLEDGKIHLECSDAKAIIMYTGNRLKRVLKAEPGTALTSAEFSAKGIFEYFRIEVRDFEGNKAFSNAYFTDTFQT